MRNWEEETLLVVLREVLGGGPVNHQGQTQKAIVMLLLSALLLKTGVRWFAPHWESPVVLQGREAGCFVPHRTLLPEIPLGAGGDASPERMLTCMFLMIFPVCRKHPIPQ